MYQKMTIHFQHFYNDHDLLSLSSLLIFPLCHRTVARTTIFWDTQAWATRPRNAKYMDICDQITALHTVKIDGVQAMIDTFETIFKNVPDSIMLFGDVSVQEIHDQHDVESADSSSGGGGVKFRAPYSYLFKLPVLSKSSSNGEYEQSISTRVSKNGDAVPLSVDTEMIDVELKGCLEMHFSLNNQIYEIFDHCSLVSHHDTPFFSMTGFIRHMGF